MPDRSCAAVVLAAGASTRLGQPKQLLSYEGETLLHRTARAALEAGCAPVIAVLGYEAARMGAAIADLAVSILDNQEWQQGMGSSLRKGVRALVELHPSADRVLMLVCDQPRIDTEVLRKLVETHATAGNAITASQYAGRLGVPAIFSVELYAELLEVSGDQGARSVIAAHEKEVTIFPWPEGSLDVDTDADVATMRGVVRSRD